MSSSILEPITRAQHPGGDADEGGEEGASHGQADPHGDVGDAIEALEKCGAEYDVFEGIGNNPELEQCYDAGTAARSFKADFIVGIGGGSPLDASKAVAAFAANDMTPDDIFKNTFENGVLPIISFRLALMIAFASA